jgi:small subunit ribosomal protein S1
MVHISELSWSRLDKPEEAVNVGESIQVKVIGIESVESSEKLKIALSSKQLSGDPWDSAEDQFHPGEKVKGKVTRCMKFGAFVEIAPGIEGLVHISEMSYIKRILKPEDVVKPGETVNVMIKELDLENRKIALSLKDAEGDPWVDIGEKYTIGQTLEGTIEKKEKFGYFISLEPGITGLLPISKIKKVSKPALIEKTREGQPLAVIIEEIHPAERKITLAPGDSGDEGNWREYTAEKKQSLGDLGAKLQQALKSQKDKSS